MPEWFCAKRQNDFAPNVRTILRQMAEKYLKRFDY